MEKSICGDGAIQEGELCDDGNIYPFDGCFNCQFSCIDGCNICQKGICLSCQDGWQYEKTQNYCQKTQISLILENNYTQLFDSNFVLQSFKLNLLIQYQSIQHLNCKLIYQKECIVCNLGYQLNELGNCDPIKDYQFPQNGECDSQLNNYFPFQCQWNNHYFQLDQSSVCLTGSELEKDNLNEKKLITKKEDDFCQLSCTFCLYSICYECQTGYVLSLGYCQEICGLSILAQNTLEKCVCDQQCSNCQYSTCNQCNENYILIQNQCLNVCGNGILQDYEECDDGNNIQYDGCYDCQYQCSSNCQNCVQGVCQDQCKYGFFYINVQCVTICGDSIQAGNEQCDDGNQDKLDGCYKCEYYCPVNCNYCFQGICQECYQGFSLKENMCINNCGDGLLTHIEECDDNNRIDGDGCSKNCQVEENWICKQDQECIFAQYPKMILQFLDQQNQYQKVLLKFSEPVQLKENVNSSQLFQLSILHLNSTQFNYTILEVQAAKLQIPQYVEYIFEIVIQQNLNYYPILFVQLKKQLFNNLDFPLKSQFAHLQIKKPNIILQQEIEISEIFKTINEISVKSLCGTALFSTLLGSYFSFQSVLDALLEQSYLRFLNVLYPQTLMIYFESSKVVSLKPILNFMTHHQLEDILYNFRQLQSYEKFKFYQINADLGENIRTIALIFFLYFVIVLIIHFASIFLTNLEQTWFIQMNLIMIRSIQIVKRKIIKLKNQLMRKGFKIILKASSWDLIFMSLLQLKTNLFSFQIRDYICNSLAILILSSGFILGILTLKGIKQWKKESFKVFWVERFELFYILKKFMILFCLVCQQKQQEFQTIGLTVIGLIYFIYIAKFKVFANQLEQLKAIFFQFSVTLFTASTFCNLNLLTQYLSYENKIFISWIQMSVLSSALVSLVLIEIYNSISLAINIINKSRKIKEIKANRISQIAPEKTTTSQTMENDIKQKTEENLKTIFQRRFV